ncbi:MAG TPA: hypothetical protein VK176_09670, partial [Phycisphaerales bacterium]|nr:hypothetical protein [Phycisphaerales bacterium]
MTFTTFQNGSTSSTNNSTPVNQFTPNYNGFTGGYTPGFNGYPTNVPFGYVNPFLGGQAFHAPFNTFQGNGSYNGFYPTNFVNTFGSYPTGYTTGGQNFNGFSWPTSNWSWNTVPFNGFQNWYTPFGGYNGSYTPAFFGGYTGGYRNFGGYNGLGGYTPFNTWN